MEEYWPQNLYIIKNWGWEGPVLYKVTKLIRGSGTSLTLVYAKYLFPLTGEGDIYGEIFNLSEERKITMEFPDDDSALLWFRLNYGG
jgi:hypothetical protein